MWDTRSVEMVVDLPLELAEDVEELQREDPEYLRKVIRYGLKRRLVYRQLWESYESGGGPGEGGRLDAFPT